MEASTIDLTTADVTTEKTDDEPYFHIEVVEELRAEGATDEELVPPLGPIDPKLSDEEAATELANSEWERVVKECQEVPRGMPLDVFVPGAEIAEIKFFDDERL